MDTALNNYVALHYNSRHMSWVHCFGGVGTIISQYIMRYALMYSVCTKGYRMVSYIQFGIVFIIVLTLPLWRINKNASVKGNQTKSFGIEGALKIKGIPYLLIGFMSYCAPEATAMLWASSYLERIIGIQMASAYVGSTFMPLLFDLIANHTSLKLMPVYLAFFLILLFIMISKTEKECFCCEINNIL